MFLLKDGVRYDLWQPQNEEELEEIFLEHYKEIFGKDAICFNTKKVIESNAQIASIPDAYIIYTNQPHKWSIVEVELSSHNVFSHIVPQINKFANGIKNQLTLRKITKALHTEIKNNQILKAWVRDKIGSGEIHEFLSNAVYEKPDLVIVVEKKTAQLEEAIRSQSLESNILEIKTFRRKGAEDVHAHLFPSIAPKFPSIPKDKPVRKGYTGTSPSALYFKGTKYEVHTWKSLLMRMLDIMYRLHSSNFQRVLNLRGEKRPYFSRNKGELRAPQQISETNIFIETNLSANLIVKICHRALGLFGYSKEDLKIDIS